MLAFIVWWQNCCTEVTQCQGFLVVQCLEFIYIMRFETSKSNRFKSELTSDDVGLSISRVGFLWKAKYWNLKKSQTSQCLMLCKWLIEEFLFLDLKFAAWPVSSINQGIVYSCMVHMKSVVFLCKWTSSLVSSWSCMNLVTYGSCTSSSCWDYQVENS